MQQPECEEPPALHRLSKPSTIVPREPSMLSRRSILIAVAAAGAAAAAPAFAASPKPFDAKAFTDAQSAGKPILVWIHASWCPTCKAQTPILGELTDDPQL